MSVEAGSHSRPAPLGCLSAIESIPYSRVSDELLSAKDYEIAKACTTGAAIFIDAFLGTTPLAFIVTTAFAPDVYSVRAVLSHEGRAIHMCPMSN